MLGTNVALCVQCYLFVHARPLSTGAAFGGGTVRVHALVFVGREKAICGGCQPVLSQSAVCPNVCAVCVFVCVLRAQMHVRAPAIICISFAGGSSPVHASKVGQTVTCAFVPSIARGCGLNLMAN